MDFRHYLEIANVSALLGKLKLLLFIFIHTHTHPNRGDVTEISAWWLDQNRNQSNRISEFLEEKMCLHCLHYCPVSLSSTVLSINS